MLRKYQDPKLNNSHFHDGKPRLYDCEMNRLLTDDDLPEGITVADMAEFLTEMNVTFHALGGKAVEGQSALDWADHSVFRVGTIEFPVRGLSVYWDGIQKWIADRPEREGAEAAACALEASQDAVYTLLRQAQNTTSGLHLTRKEIDILVPMLEKTRG